MQHNEEMNDGGFTQAFTRHGKVFAATQSLIPDSERAANLLWDAVSSGKVMFTCGNGGSAADAQHLAAEFTCKYNKDRKPLAAISLTGNSSHMTAVGNDYSFDDVFSRQIEALGHEDDVLVAFTTSGASKNVLKAIDVARAKNMKVIVLTGEKGKYLGGKVDILLAVPSTETARVQEMHELIYHAWCEFIDAKIIS